MLYLTIVSFLGFALINLAVNHSNDRRTNYKLIVDDVVPKFLSHFFADPFSISSAATQVQKEIQERKFEVITNIRHSSTKF